MDGRYGIYMLFSELGVSCICAPLFLFVRISLFKINTRANTTLTDVSMKAKIPCAPTPLSRLLRNHAINTFSHRTPVLQAL